MTQRQSFDFAGSLVQLLKGCGSKDVSAKHTVQLRDQMLQLGLGLVGDQGVLSLEFVTRLPLMQLQPPPPARGSKLMT